MAIKKENIKIGYNVHGVIRDAKTGNIKREFYRHNLIPDEGLESLASRLQGASSVGVITYLAVGTDGTAPTSSSTTLGTEIFRKLISVRSVSGKVATFRTFINTSEANNTLAEAGLFGDDASSTADSGTMFAHVNISETKTDTETMTLDWDFTLSDVT